MSTATAAASASAPNTLADEFPEDPPTSPVTYRSLAPHVELARVDGRPTKNATSLSSLPVLVGWFGCKPSHLRKYAKMYLADSGENYDSVVCITPPVAATLFPALGDAFAATALSAVASARRTLAIEGSGLVDKKHKLEIENKAPSCSVHERPLILHLFSNGGYLFAGNVMHAQTGFVADTETPLGEELSTALRRKLGMAPAPEDAARFVESVAALVMDSAPGELEPGMVAASFDSVLSGKAVEIDEAESYSTTATRQLSQSLLAWPPIAKRLRYVDAAWGGFPAVTGNKWSGDRKSRPGNAAEVAHAVVEKKLQRLKLEQEKMSQSSDQTIESPESSETLFGILKCPSLFLYSAGDALIPPEGVEQFAAARARRLGTVSSALSDGAGAGGGRVVLKKWESPKHVEIGRDDPDGYSKALMNFLNPQPAAERVNNIKPFIRANVDRENVKATETDVTNA